MRIDIIRLCTLLLVILPCCGYLNNHTFVFVSGWPQSGTSFLNQIFSITPNISTMVKKCDEMIGPKCINWNHEGQWMLKASTHLTKMYNPGSICPCQENAANELKQSIQMQWKSFWSVDQTVLVEKSPQNLLKIPFIRSVFSGAKKLKFIVVIKHPATLNIATPKDMKWISHTVKSGSAQSQNGIRKTVKEAHNSPSQINSNIQYFIDFLIHNRSSTGRECSLGWLPAMSMFRKYLLEDVNSTLLDVRILRYEDFQSAYTLCKAIFAFVFDSVISEAYNNSVVRVCDVHFPPNLSDFHKRSHPYGIPQVLSNTRSRLRRPQVPLGHIKDRRQLEALSRHQIDVNTTDEKIINLRAPAQSNAVNLDADYPSRRNLRLKIEKDHADSSGGPKSHATTLNFRPEVVAESGLKRFAEFNEAYAVANPELRKMLDLLDRRLAPFGYNFRTLHAYRQEKTVFDPWDIMKLYLIDKK